MANTHYLNIVGDAHIRGYLPRDINHIPHVDRLKGRLVRLQAAPTPAVQVNDVIRAATSGNVGRVVQILSTTEFVIEAFANAAAPIAGAVIGVQMDYVASTTPTISPFTLGGETVTFTPSGGSGVIESAVGSQLMPWNQQFWQQIQDDDNLGVPADLGDSVLWQRGTKAARRVTLTGITGAGYRAGDVVTTPSGSAIVLLGAAAGNGSIRIVRVQGAITNGQTLTNGTIGGVTGTISDAGTEFPTGAFHIYHPNPNIGGAGTYYDRPPLGNGHLRTIMPAIGPELKLLRKFADYYSRELDPANRFVRCVAHSSIDDLEGDPHALIGGVTIQCVVTTGSTGTWALGQPVTGPGGWSAIVFHYQDRGSFGYLYVINTNGAVLGAGAVTSATASATCSGPARGWAKGSTNWNNWVAQVYAAVSSPASEGSFGGQPGGAAAKHEAMFSMIWECELAQHASVNGCPFPPIFLVQEAWKKWAADVRAELGNPDMRIVQWMHREESQASSVFLVPGYSGARVLRDWIKSLVTLIPNFTVVDSVAIGAEMAFVRGPAALGGFTPPGAESVSSLWLRPLDYYALGDHLFQHWRGGQYTVPPGDGLEALPFVFAFGQSQMTGFASAALAMAFDQDPELYSSASFPGFSTIDPKVVSYDHVLDDIRPYDVNSNDNGFWNTSPGTFGPTLPVVRRGAYCWSKSTTGASGPFGLFKVSIPGSSFNREAALATACFDPDLVSRTPVVVTATVSSVPPSGPLPVRGRFTASAPGAFTASGFPYLVAAQIEGSNLGALGVGGNNVTGTNIARIYAVDPAGQWVEFEGPFVPETRAFTFRVGPPPAWPAVVDAFKNFTLICRDKGYVPVPVGWMCAQSESDLERVDEYEAAFTRVVNAVNGLLDRLRRKGDPPLSKIVQLQPTQTGWNVPDETLAQMRDIQRRVIATQDNCLALDISDMTLELKAPPVFPRTTRQDNGLHLTGAGIVEVGKRYADLFEQTAGWPAHPRGRLSVSVGGAINGTPGGPTDGGIDGPGEGADALVVEDGSGLPDAESFASVVDFRAYWAANGGTGVLLSATDGEIEVVLRRATREWAEGVVGSMWRGQVQYSTQRLAFPRVDCFDDEGRVIARNSVPWQLVHAVCIVAGDLLLGGTILSNGFDRGPILQETRKGAGFEKTTVYGAGGGASGPSQSIRRIRAAEALVYPLIRSGSLEVDRS